jgi:hypothetical protein
MQKIKFVLYLLDMVAKTIWLHSAHVRFSIVYSHFKTLNQKWIFLLQNAPELTYSIVEFQKFSEGQTRSSQLKGRGGAPGREDEGRERAGGKVSGVERRNPDPHSEGRHMVCPGCREPSLRHWPPVACLATRQPLNGLTLILRKLQQRLPTVY